ncbi:MAG: fibronectin type III domain-containing protein [Actinobacteria bacterium]|nr:MAG: fibronectin type III domain-containing protein [Actinomycetota bacterium]
MKVLFMTAVLLCFLPGVALAQDATPPTEPVVTDDGTKTANLRRLHARWTCEDLESGIAEYQYRIGTAMGGAEVHDWVSTGTDDSFTETGLNLTVGTTYYVSVRARNNEGLWSETGISDGITAVNMSQLNLLRNPSAIYYWWTATLSGMLKEDWPAISTDSIQMQRRQVGATSWTTIASGISSDENGNYDFPDRPAYNSDYRTTWSGDGYYAATQSPVVRVYVRPRVYLNANTYSIRRGGLLALSGEVIPARAGKQMLVRYRYGSSWRDLGWAKTNASSRYVYYYRPRYPGTYLFRVNFNADSLNAWSTSRYITVRVY